MLRRLINAHRVAAVPVGAATTAFRFARTTPVKTNNEGIIVSDRPDITDQLKQFTTFHAMYCDRCDRFADRTAMVCGSTGTNVSYAELSKMTDTFAQVLYHKYSVRQGTVVSILSPNTVYFPSLFQAILRLGAIASPMNPTFTQEEIEKQLKVSKSCVIVVFPLFAPVANAAAAHISNTDFACRVLKLKDVLGAPAETCDDVVPVSATVHGKQSTATQNDVVVLPFSSGTTGLPKGVQLTNQNLLANIFQGQESVEYDERDVLMSVLPFFHIYGMMVLLHNCINVGAKQVIMPKFEMEPYMKLIEAHKASLLFVAPPIVVGFVKHPVVQTVKRDSVRLIFSGAAPLGEGVQKAAEKLFPKAVFGQGYGLTETSPILAVSPFVVGQTIAYGSAGVPVSNTEFRVVNPEIDDPNGVDVKQGETGELWARGPQVMKGYLREEDTAQVMRPGGWFRTGDLVYMDKDGNMFVTDRIKELIKFKGYQVAPAELEALLVTHPIVQDAVVVGIPATDGSGNELPCAHVVLKPGSDTALIADGGITAAPFVLNKFVDSHVSDYKKLRGGIRIVDAIPKTASGKLLRRVAKKQELEWLKADEAHQHEKPPTA